LGFPESNSSTFYVDPAFFNASKISSDETD